MLNLTIILHNKVLSYIYNAMNNEYLNKPLYPESEYPKNDNMSNNQTQNEQRNNNSLFGNLSSILSGQNGGNPLLSLLLGMKGGNGGLSSILSKVGEGNPLFQALSSFQNNEKQEKKKESENSPKPISKDEILC